MHDLIYWDEMWNSCPDKEQNKLIEFINKPSTGTYNWIEQLKNKQNNDTHR